ncbi:MAG: putative lipoprotein YerB precursor [Pelotomaculum sp. PtaB.Bin104]|nr:MAG: putative lipoprotein YerB precursor [Pelotomaculum sp. PtaB.Bin104]
MFNFCKDTFFKNIYLFLIIVFLLTALSGCGKKVDQEAVHPVGENMPPAAKYSCPLDGAPINEIPVRPIAVTIDNFSSARPQSGLDQADLVYEVPVEGGITRYLAIFFHGEAKTIGPVRSARPYLIDLAREWDAVYIHVGQSPQAQAYFAQNKIAHINEMLHSSGFWRDKSRKAPYNLYTGTDSLWQEINKLGLNKKVSPEGYSFRKESEGFAGKTAKKLIISYPYGRVGYQYDANTGTYLRFLNNSPYKDAISGIQLSVANVLIQQVSIRPFDSEGRLEVGLIGKGRALLFSDGQVQEGTWQKDSTTHRTRFYDQTGVEMQMKTGKTWIQLISGQLQVSYQ